MGTILDYAREVDAPFSARPFSEVDSLVLSELAYQDFSQVSPPPGQGFVPFRRLSGEDAVAALVKDGRVPQLDGELIRRVAANPRFEGMEVGEFVNTINRDWEVQFSAVTFRFPAFAYIAYRGTDSSYVAWKENFNMTYLDPIPSQFSGVEYLNRVAHILPGPLRVGGHSKGGNVAVYSALFCRQEVRDRVLAVYSHDGPGLSEKTRTSPQYAQTRDRILKTIPQSSLIGMLLQEGEAYRVIRSGQFWILQHDPFSWVVEEGEFRSAEDLSSGARFLDNGFNYWIASLSKEELAAFSDALYQVLRALPGETFNDLPDKWWQAVGETLSGLRGLDRRTYANVLGMLRSILSLAVRSVPLPKLPLPGPGQFHFRKEAPQPHQSTTEGESRP